MDVFTALWVLWLAAFGVIEGLALANKRADDTLSEHVWKWFSVKNKSGKFRAARMTGLAGFLVWLGVHFLSGGAV